MMNSAKIEKMTYVTALTAAIECGNLPAEVVEKLTALRTQQEKRNSAEKKPTKVQEANTGIKAEILTLMAGQEAKTVSEIMAMSESLQGMSNQKVSALISQLVKEGKLTRIEEKRKAYFKVA